tara:strand:- start:972 stop:1166 length:195 start_codon:yes stop_codon:yes gene_type:complete
MKKVTLTNDQVKIIEAALILSYECCDGSPILKHVDYDHSNFQKNLEHDLDVANQIHAKLRKSNE